MATSEETSSTDKKPEKKKGRELVTVINILGSKGHMTNLAGERIPPGGSLELPLELCEKLVATNKARYLTKAEQGSG